MYQTIIDAMKELGDAGLVFGVLRSQDGEKEFQKDLGQKLQDLTGSDGWDWRSSHRNKEEGFRTKALTNKDRIKVDVFGRHRTKGTVAIELKYRRDQPKDLPTFTWEVAKDCLKLDLLQAGFCIETKSSGPLPDPNTLQTYVLALTNWPDYWRGNANMRWATNFAEVMRSSSFRFEDLIQTTGSNPDNTIFKQKRCHVAFGRPWRGEWRPYSSMGEAEKFRFLFLHPMSSAQPRWTHDQLSISKQSEIIPFLNDASREEFKRRGGSGSQSAAS